MSCGKLFINWLLVSYPAPVKFILHEGLNFDGLKKMTFTKILNMDPHKVSCEQEKFLFSRCFAER